MNSSILQQPFTSALELADSILIAGAGGGFDIFAGLPLYFALKNKGKQVHLANFTFTELDFVTNGDWMTESLLRVTPDTETRYARVYFPELYLAKWLVKNAEEKGVVSIYTFSRNQGVVPLNQNYQHLVNVLGIDAIVLVDGGTDSLMRGDEDGVGTPEEDLTSLAAVHAIENVPTKLLVCAGFGVDHFHGVSNDLSLRAIAQLTHSGDFLGSLSLIQQMPEVAKYRDATEYVFKRMPNNPSIVSSSILSAIEGHYGDHHSTHRTLGSRLWINPLMAIYWCFTVSGVVERNRLIPYIMDTKTSEQVESIILRWLRKLDTVHRQPIPS